MMMETTGKILIVDDVEDNLTILGHMLIKQGFVIHVAQNGAQALKMVHRKPPDLILLDISMPGLSGYEVCKALKKDKQTSTIPIIFLTAHTETKDIVEGFKVGAVDYIAKPFNQEELLSRVKTHLELKHSRVRLKKQNEQLIELNATKDRFFSIIAHDLKNPFNAILGFSELAVSQIKKRDYNEIEMYCGYVNKATKQAVDLLNNLLQWSSIQTGKMKFEPRPLILFEIVENNLLLAKANYKEKNIKLSTAVDPDIIVIADSFMIETIIRNLLLNAVKYTYVNGKIKIAAIQKDSDIEISVEDNGVGISEKNIKKLFEIESNFSMPGTNEEEGTGLGLILCKEFVEKHSGKIWVESEEGKGAKFIFTIPNKRN